MPRPSRHRRDPPNGPTRSDKDRDRQEREPDCRSALRADSARSMVHPGFWSSRPISLTDAGLPLGRCSPASRPADRHDGRAESPPARPGARGRRRWRPRPLRDGLRYVAGRRAAALRRRRLPLGARLRAVVRRPDRCRQPRSSRPGCLPRRSAGSGPSQPGRPGLPGRQVGRCRGRRSRRWSSSRRSAWNGRSCWRRPSRRGYDLTAALRAVRREMVVFWSPLDVVILGAGTRVFGTIDRVRTVSAGLVGFRVPAARRARRRSVDGQYAKLRQVRWRPGWRRPVIWAVTSDRISPVSPRNTSCPCCGRGAGPDRLGRRTGRLPNRGLRVKPVAARQPTDILMARCIAVAGSDVPSPRARPGSSGTSPPGLGPGDRLSSAEVIGVGSPERIRTSSLENWHLDAAPRGGLRLLHKGDTPPCPDTPEGRGRLALDLLDPAGPRPRPRPHAAPTNWRL